MKKNSAATVAREPLQSSGPRQYTVREQVVFGAKFGSAVGFVVLLIWLLDKYT